MKQLFKRVLLIVLDGVGVGALPDAANYGDADAATLPHVAAAVGGLRLPLLQSFGLGNICPLVGVPAREQPLAAWGRMAQRCAGKDSVSGHWEIAGYVEPRPFAVFPQGFPPEIIAQFSRLAGCEPLGNFAASGTEIIRQLGEEHLASGRPIVYTSCDSVFQIAAHEERLPPEQLYALCEQTLEMLTPYRVCRVIARPFIGRDAHTFQRTQRRHDFPLAPGGQTLLDRLQAHQIPRCGIGKIGDLFSHRGLDISLPTTDNSDGMNKLRWQLKQQSHGLIFVNLVDFDTHYGHRLDPQGFAGALEAFDRELTELLPLLEEDDLLMITADHGCDPTTPGTDHTREYVPLLVWNKRLGKGRALGTRESFADIAASLAQVFAVDMPVGESFLPCLNSENGTSGNPNGEEGLSC